MSFINKVVIITGAGSGGIGEAVALHMSKLSARLALVDINAANLKTTADKCEKLSQIKVLKITADLANDKDVKRIVDDTVKEYGKIDVLVNAAGIYAPSGILDDDFMKKFDATIAVNLRSIVSLIHSAAPVLIQNRGNIVNISSVYGRTPGVVTTYPTAKAALTHLSKCIALNLSEHGVRVNTVSPGAAKTNLLINTGMTAARSTGIWDIAGKILPLKHTVYLEDISELVAFLASDRGRSITGADHVIDCGFALIGNDGKA